MFNAVTEFFAGLADGFATPAGQIFAVLAALALLVVAYNALAAALRTESSVAGTRPSTAAAKPAKALPRAA